MHLKDKCSATGYSPFSEKLTIEELGKIKGSNQLDNNLLSNLSSTEDELETAELNLEDAKNNLSLAEINISLKNTLITQKKNINNPKTKELDTFNVALNISKQYNIQSIISINNTKKFRKNTLTSPKDSFFKKELLKSLEISLNDAKLSFIKSPLNGLSG